ncbi:uncharacterized protein BKCO1_34000107 [Diplodia corticola]|uniref:Uncharacterized protein n=1 Tax=Diplodia corticola TaxID=236234 RepID=A0A1J9RX79_9PEZI|nr:uncharacterized protein BKCO1_34000107 [Diplodia corticola]OJD32951.1 hypothetical protein BKCO1_34000107 [Diplodia corticola]
MYGTTASVEKEDSHPSEHKFEGRANETWMFRTADERWEMYSHLRILEQKIELLYHAVNKVQNDHEELSSIVTGIAREIMSEASAMSDFDTKASPQYLSCDSETDGMEGSSDVRSIRGGSHPSFNLAVNQTHRFLDPFGCSEPEGISELPGITAETLKPEAPRGQPGDFHFSNPLHSLGRSATPPIHLDTFSDTSEQRATPPHHRFRSEFGRPRPLPILPNPYLPPPRPPPHGRKPESLNLESSRPITACAYFASPSETPLSLPTEPGEGQHDSRRWTHSYGRGYRMGRDGRAMRHRGSASEQTDGAYDGPSNTIGPGGFGTRDEVLDSLRWTYRPDQGWVGNQSDAPDPVSTDDSRSSTASWRHGAYFGTSDRERGRWANWRDRPAEGGSSNTTRGECMASDTDGESNDSEKTTQPRSPQEVDPVLRLALRLVEIDYQQFRKSQISHTLPPPVSQQPSQRHGHREDGTKEQPVAPRRASLPQQPCSFLSSHDILGLAAIVLLSPEENEGFPRDLDPCVRYMQGAILWASFLQRPAPDSQAMVWMTGQQIESHIVRFLRAYCTTRARIDTDAPTFWHQARAIVSALLRKAERSPSGQVTLLELWRTRRPRLRVMPRQARDPMGFRRELDRVRINAPYIGGSVGGSQPDSAASPHMSRFRDLMARRHMGTMVASPESDENYRQHMGEPASVAARRMARTSQKMEGGRLYSDPFRQQNHERTRMSPAFGGGRKDEDNFDQSFGFYR